jgi:protocatechuate 3,4-dioxygenase beta subunit
MVRLVGTMLVMAVVLCASGRTDARNPRRQEQGAAGQAGARHGSTNGQGVVPEYSITGTAVDTTTGQGVPHALVELSIYKRVGETGPPTTRRVMTDEDGRFEIRGLTTVGRAGGLAVEAWVSRRDTSSNGLRKEHGSVSRVDN